MEGGGGGRGFERSESLFEFEDVEEVEAKAEEVEAKEVEET